MVAREAIFDGVEVLFGGLRVLPKIDRTVEL
jgi:hypothetical protein